MKALIAAFASIALTVSIWIFFINHSDQTLNELAQIVEKEVYSNICKERWDDAELAFSKASEKWHANKKIYNLFLDQHTISETDFSIARAKDYIKTKSPALALGELSCIKEQLKFLHENELLNLDNIF